MRAAQLAVSRGEFEQMTIRSLARTLDVSPMALYRHVRDKDDLVDEVVNRLLSRKWQPRASRDDWKAWTTEAAEKFRDFLIRQPAALHLYLRHPVTSTTSVTRMNGMLDVLRAAGFDEATARRAYAAIHTYTIGFAALEASRARGTSLPEEPDQLTVELASFTTPTQFSVGLAYLLDGIATDLPRRKGRA